MEERFFKNRSRQVFLKGYSAVIKIIPDKNCSDNVKGSTAFILIKNVLSRRRTDSSDGVQPAFAPTSSRRHEFGWFANIVEVL